MIEHTAGRNAVQAPALFRALLEAPGVFAEEIMVAAAGA
jgi:hypothetical protein